MDVILSNALQAVLIIVLPPLAVAVFQWLKSVAGKLLAEAQEWNPTITDLAMRAARFAVEAAEQAGAAELIEDKKKYALEVAQLWLTANKVTIDLALIDAAIERAVLEMKEMKEVKEFSKENVEASG